MKQNTFYYYPRDKSGKYTGVSVTVILKNDRPFVGVAITGKDDQFDKKKGRNISTGVLRNNLLDMRRSDMKILEKMQLKIIKTI